MTVTIDSAAALAIDEAAADVLYRSARTAREWTDAEVSDADLQAAWDLAKFGPTAMNTLPLRFAVLRSAESKARLSALMPDGNKERVESSPVTLVLAYDPDFHEQMDTLFPVAPGMREQLAPAAERRAGMAAMNAHLQTGYLLLALRAAGLAVGPRQAADYDAVAEEFFAGTGFVPFLVVNAGHAEGDGTPYPRLPRLGYSEVALER